MTAPYILAGLAVLIVLSFAAAPRRANVDGFFAGQTRTGQAPGLWVLVLSQVTTWIFARSLLNSAILGYYYGIAGVLAYAAYYGSFITGSIVVGQLRKNGAHSVQDWLKARFGPLGTGCYNLVIALRLLSEVFANLLVVGLIFEAVMPGSQTVAILAIGILALTYSAWGGLSAALRTDVIQMVVFFGVFGAALIALVTQTGFDLGAVLTAQGSSGGYLGWVLLVVAALQVFSYPVHDPVMMDRGFVADPVTTRWSFLHAFWISSLCIILFGMFGIQAQLVGAAYENNLLGTWATILPGWVFILLMLSLLISALSTLDSALSSSARLMVEELQILPRSLAGGRLAMIAFALGGMALTLWGNAALFDAVAVSGTASMFLTPVLLVGLIGNRIVPHWSYLVAWGAAMLGAVTYFGRSWPFFAQLLPEGHKYEQLLVICIVVLVIGFSAVLVGASRVAAPKRG